MTFYATIEVYYYHNTVFSDPPDVPKDAAATEFPLDRPGTCVLLIDWDPPNFINSLLTIKQYIICTSIESRIPQTNETRTLATFESPCNEIVNITINITAVDVCGQVSETTANFKPTLAVTEPSDVTRTTVSPSTVTTQAPQRFGIREYYCNMVAMIINFMYRLLVFLC